MTRENDQLPEPPACAPWCTSHPAGAGWHVHPAAVTKTCRKIIETGADVDGSPVTIELEQFADLDSDTVTVDETTVRVTITGLLTVTTAALLGEALLRVADLGVAPGLVA